MFVCLLEIHYFVALAYVVAISTSTAFRHLGQCLCINTAYHYIVLCVCYGYVIFTQRHVCLP